MQQIVTTITQRGQVTIPAEVRRVLGVGARDRVAFEIENGTVRLVPAPLTLEQTYASVPPKHRPEDLDAVLDAAKAEHASSILDELRDS
jgi:AbrB family looped-hinge helix DNA binding protein